MNQGTLNELRADNAQTHALLTELVGTQKRTNELLAILLLTEPSKEPEQPASAKPKTAAKKGK